MCVLAGLAALALVAGDRVAAATDSTRASMHGLLEALATLLPAAVEDSSGQDPTQREELDAALLGLGSAAAHLEALSPRREETFRFFSRSLATDAHAIRQRVAQGRYAAAAHLIRRLPETCAACHVRLPAHSARGLGEPLLARLYGAAADPLLRARLQTATYQFDPALSTYEQQFARAAPADLALEASVASYLLVALRVRLAPQRARSALSILERRSDVSAHLAQNLRAWREALLDFGAVLAEPPSLCRARAILARGGALRDVAADADDLVHRLIASSLVHRFLDDQRRPSRRERAEAFYLLGQTEWWTRRAFERADAEHYLEQAIRNAPHTPLAARAFAQLERSLVLGYTGSSGEHVPLDVRLLIEELRRLSSRFGRPRTAARLAFLSSRLRGSWPACPESARPEEREAASHRAHHSRECPR